MNDWREDRADFVKTPSGYVISLPDIHTSRTMNEGKNQLFDIFYPSEMGFSQKDGRMLSADDYPLPADGK